jgi:hypothetical protein
MCPAEKKKIEGKWIREAEDQIMHGLFKHKTQQCSRLALDHVIFPGCPDQSIREFSE